VKAQTGKPVCVLEFGPIGGVLYPGFGPFVGNFVELLGFDKAVSDKAVSDKESAKASEKFPNSKTRPARRLRRFFLRRMFFLVLAVQGGRWRTSITVGVLV